MRVISVTLAVIVWAAEAAAGAWPREPGSGFLSLGYEVTTSRAALRPEATDVDPSPDFTGYGTLYAEIGITPRFTAGFDLGGDEVWLTAMINDEIERMTRAQGLTQAEIDAFDATDRQVRTWSGVAFGRLALGALDARHRFAVQLGAGRRSYEEPGLYFGLEEMRQEAILRPALAYGLGFGGEAVQGWLAVDASVEFRARTGGEVYKLDTTLGMKRTKSRLAWLVQVFAADFPEAEPSLKLQPGIVLDVWRGVSLESGLIYGVRGDDSVGAKVALWLEW